MSARVHVAAIGVQTAIGRTALAAAAAVRGLLTAGTLHPYLVDRMGRPVRVAPAPWLGIDTPLADRMLTLGADAAEAALAAFAPALAAAGVGLHLITGLPAARPGLPGRFEETLLRGIERRVAQHLPVPSARARSLGHVSGLVAIEEGARAIRDGATHAVLAGGVESYIDRETIEWLDWTGQLLAATNPRGFIPGEAAAFCLLVSDELRVQLALPSLAEVLAAATAIEPKLRRDQAVCVGEGLTEAFRRTLAALPDAEARVDHLIYDFNGQPQRAEEYGFSAMRVGRLFRDPAKLATPAECWGDVGGASGPLSVMLGVVGHQKGYTPGPHVLVWASAMLAERSAALFHVNPS